MTQKQKEVYIKYFRHFAERLSLRYNILITFEEYIELCGLEIDVAEVQKEANTNTQLGYLVIKGKTVKIVKWMNFSGYPLTTALPVNHGFNTKKK